MRWLIALWIVSSLAASALFGQETSSEAELAKAFVAEETSAGVEEALGLYSKVAGSAGAEATLRARAMIGRARCLHKLGRFDEGRAALGGLDPATLPKTVADEMGAVRVALDAAPGKQDETKAEVLRRVQQLAPRQEILALADLGRPAIPFLVTIAETGLLEGVAIEPKIALRALTTMRVPEIVEVLTGLMTRRKLERRDQLVSLVLAAPTPTPGFEGSRLLRPDLAPVILVGLADPDPLTRQVAARALDALPSLPIESWRRALEDSQPPVRLVALDALARTNQIGREDQLAFWRQLAKDPSPEVRTKVAESLPRILQTSDGVALELALELLADSEAAVRRAAVSRLGVFNVARTTPILVRAFSDPDVEVRRVAIRSFRGEGSDVAAARVLLDDVDADVRGVASGLLLRNLSSRELCATPADEARFVRLLDDADPQVRRLALSVLARAGSTAVADKLLEFAGDIQGEGAAAVVYFMYRHDLVGAYPRVLPFLTSLRGSASFSTGQREPTAHAARFALDAQGIIQWLTARRHVDALFATLAQADALSLELCRILGRGLAAVTEAPVADRLLAGLQGIRDPERRGVILGALGNGLGTSPPALAFLSEALRSESPKLRYFAVPIVAAARGKDGVRELCEALRVEVDEGVIDNLKKQLARLATPADAELLAAGTEVENPTVREAFVHVIGGLGPETASEIFLKLLDSGRVDREVVYRNLAASRIDAGHDRILAALEGGSLDNDLSARTAAFRALGAYGRETGLAALRAALVRWPGDLVRDTSFEVFDTGLDGQVSESREGFLGTVHPALAALFNATRKSFPAEVSAILGSTASDATKGDAVRLLAFVDEAAANDSLSALLVVAEPNTRVAAIQAVGAGIIAELAPLVRAGMRSSDANVRRAAAAALLRLEKFGG